MRESFVRGVVVFLAVWGAAGPARALDADELLRRVDRNLNPESYEMYRKLINIEPDGKRKEFVLFTAKKGRDAMIALFLDPPSEKERDHSVAGGVFNNADI